MDYLPAFVAAAFFAALLTVDMTTYASHNIGFHFTSGCLCVLGIFVLCSVFGSIAGWIFLSIPFVVLMLGLLQYWSSIRKDAVAITTPIPNVNNEDDMSGCAPPPPRRKCAPPPRQVSRCPVIPSEIASLPVVRAQNTLDSCGK